MKRRRKAVNERSLLERVDEVLRPRWFDELLGELRELGEEKHAPLQYKSTAAIDRMFDEQNLRAEKAWEAFQAFIHNWSEKGFHRDAMFAAWFGWEVGRAIGRREGVGLLIGLLVEQQNRLRALERTNSGKQVEATERERVMRLNNELKSEFPKKTPRYREMARRLSTPKKDVKESRIRYLIEGPRKIKKKP